MEKNAIQIKKDLVIVGAGVPGVVHAIQAARMGVKVALINNRGYVGGNGSAEVSVTVSGATGTQKYNYFARETGVVEELMLENLYRNPDGNRYIWDAVMMDKLLDEENIELFLNTNVFKADVEDGKITCVYGDQNTTGKVFAFEAPLYADDTGDGFLGYMAGAEFRYGREGKAEFNERIAPDEPDHYVIPSTLAFFAKDVGHKVTYKAPKFATDLTKTDVLKYRVIPKSNFGRFHWFYEIDGELDNVDDSETIIQHHRNLVYGIWDYIKNSGEYDADNYDLEFVAPIMGKRESRRIMGDHILTEGDIVNQVDFEDSVGYGGWSIDLHAIRGFYAQEPVNKHVFLKGIYQIPYRCGYSKDISNLFIEGRCMSTSHVGFGTTRVMATLATLAQANAVASYLCMKYNTTPRGVYENHLEELQQTLLKYDQYIVGKKYDDKENLAQNAKVTVSSVKKLAMTDKDGEMVMESGLSLSIPVKKEMQSVRFLMSVKQDTELFYKAYEPTKQENYHPSVLLAEKSVKIQKTDGFQWVTLPLDVTVSKPCNLFIGMQANENITFATSTQSVAGVICCYHQFHDADVLIDIDTLEKLKESWSRLNKTLCFEAGTDEQIFAGENLTNGFARPYGGTNIWQSQQVEGEYFTLKLPEKKNIREMVLIFDSDLDICIRNTATSPENSTQALVTDYNVLCKNADGEFVQVMEVRDNHQRYNALDLEGVETDEVKVEFLKTNGQKFVGVYEARLYA